MDIKPEQGETRNHLLFGILYIMKKNSYYPNFDKLEERMIPTSGITQQFVAQVIYDITYKAPLYSDIYKLSYLTDQGDSKSQVSNAILNSPEAQSSIVSSLYTTILHRQVDPFGLKAYTSLLAHGWSVEQVESSLLGSIEYFKTRDSDNIALFLHTLSLDVLDRSATTAELITQQSAIAHGTSRASLALSMTHSVEATQWFVENLYKNIDINNQSNKIYGYYNELISIFSSQSYAVRVQQMAGVLAFEVSPESGFTTTRLGGSSPFKVSLARPPIANVTISLASSNRSEGIVSPFTLTFTPSNWSTPQVFSVTGVNDHQVGVKVPYSVLFGPAVSSDSGFKGLSYPAIGIVNQDGITASFDPSTRTINFNLTSPSVTTCVVVNSQGQFIRTLWSLQQTSLGNHTAQWDGLDDSGNIALGGPYSIRMSASANSYTNVGAIGNSGKTASTADHTPVDMTSVAIGPDGGIYTADAWDEAGADFKKWDASGKSVYDANFQIRNGTPYGIPYTIAVDQRYIYCAVAGVDGPSSNPYPQFIERFRTSDGLAVPWINGDPNGHISVYDQTPTGQNYPLRAMIVAGNSLWAVDSLGNRVIEFDKTSGMLISQFAVQDPGAIAASPDGTLWIGYLDHDVGIYSTAGTFDGNVISNLDQVVSLAFGPGGKFYAADTGAGQVDIYSTTFLRAMWIGSLGRKAKPGDRAASDFYDLLGVAVGMDGSIVTIQTEAPNGGSRLAKFNISQKVAWEQFGNEFVSLGTYSQDNPNVLYTNSFHAYNLTSKAQGTWNYANNTYGGPAVSYNQPLQGVPRILRYGSSDYYFEPTGDGLQVYRIDGTTFHLVSLVGGRSPSPDGTVTTQGGEWSWSDITGSGTPVAGEIRWFQYPGSGQYVTRGMEVDYKGNLFFEDQFTQQIWEIPIGTPDSRGNPTYDWSKLVVVFVKDQSPLGLLPQSVQHADDGSYYVLGWSTPWPDPSSPLWMGGSTLVKYDSRGKLLWVTHLPEICTGMDLVPGGGVMLGGGTSASVYQYASDGMLIGSMSPGRAMADTSGWLDNQGSVAVDRDPNTGILDVFTENDYGLNIGWYQVNDSHLQEINVANVAPVATPSSPTNVSATPDQSGEIIIKWNPVNGAIGYKVERSDGDGNWTQVISVSATTNATTDIGLQASTNYYYRVTALWNDNILDGQSLGHTPIGGVSAVVSAATTSTSPGLLFSDNFQGKPTPGPAWSFPHGTWVVGPNGLSQTSTMTSNSKALVGDQAYPTDIRITAKIKVDAWVDGDNNVRVGIGLHADGTTLGYGGGYFLEFSGNQNTVLFGNDEAGYGNSYTFHWKVGQWYLFDLEFKDGVLYGNVWADGTEEPSSWQFIQSGWTLRPNGAPALSGGSIGNDGIGGSTSTFNYIEVRNSN